MREWGFRRVTSRVADGAAILAVVSLPWSTSATVILIVIWALALLPTLNWPEVKRECTTSHGATPILLFGLALLSVTWADVSLLVSLDWLRPLLKLLAIPFLFVQFRASNNGRLAAAGYLLSCTVLLAASLTSLVFPGVTSQWGFRYPGVAVKDYIAQDGEFALCAFALVLWAHATWSQQHYRRAALLAIWAALFFVSIFYVYLSRTELVVLVVLVPFVSFRLLNWRGVAGGLLLATLFFGLAWATSPLLRFRVTNVAWELRQFDQHNQVTSSGLRLEFWRKSLEMMRTAPFLGHGVGTTKTLFAEDATGRKSSATAEVTNNPHNQILDIGIQLGLVGIAALFAMWFAHFRLFQMSAGLPWLGALIVIQNAVGSLFNSHIYDFTQGWTYVFGVGVLGGLALRSSPAREELAGGRWFFKIWPFSNRLDRPRKPPSEDASLRPS